MNKLLLGIAAASTLAMACPASAAVQLFDIKLADTNALGPGDYGTIKVEDFGTDTLKITVDLANGYAFQNAGNNQPRHAVAFNLAGNPIVSFNFLTPPGGTYGSGDFFSGGGYVNDGYGQGFGGVRFDYSALVQTPSPPPVLYGAPNDLIFEVKASSGVLSIASLLGENVSVQSESGLGFFMLDLSGVPGGFKTGPAVAVKHVDTRTTVPEPATWALMILGFGSAGAMLRRRRRTAAVY